MTTKESKLKFRLYQNKKALKKIEGYNDFKMLQSILFFFQDRFEKYENLGIVYKMGLADKKQYQIESFANFSVNDNTIFIDLNVEQIAIDKNLFTNNLDSLLFCAIQILYRVRVFINFHLQQESFSLEETYDKIIKNKESIELTYEMPYHVENLYELETYKQRVDADRFSFKNLGYLRDLYNFESVL